MRASVDPSYQTTSLLPAVNPPPWIHTMTGRTGSPGPGVKTLRYRQSSLDGRSRAPRKLSVAEGFWGAIGPNVVASRTPAHGSAGPGGRKRSARA